MSGYFDEQIKTGQPIVPPVAPAAPVIPPPPPSVPQVPQGPITPPQEFVGLPVRAGGDRIFLLKKGKKFWISNPEVYAKLGFKFGDEVRIDPETLAVIPEGEILR